MYLGGGLAAARDFRAAILPTMPSSAVRILLHDRRQVDSNWLPAGSGTTLRWATFGRDAGRELLAADGVFRGRMLLASLHDSAKAHRTRRPKQNGRRADARFNGIGDCDAFGQRGDGRESGASTRSLAAQSFALRLFGAYGIRRTSPVPFGAAIRHARLRPDRYGTSPSGSRGFAS